ncbi:MAG TPA: ABC transporter ATP-binding protein, partial [Rhodobacterales bacterium]|nr:ABC transporter ATP-binding protein [Rhodobacterales bacterium]
MFRLFENLVDPFAPHDGATPPARVWPYLKSHFGNFGRWMWWMAATGVAVALIETGLIFYTGRIVDLMDVTPADTFWRTHGLELFAAALFVLLLRPLVIVLNHLFLEQTLAGNMQDQVRWRAHKHMLGQSMGFFQNDFAGRLSNRVMQLGPAVEDSTYMAFEGIWYSITYVVAAIVILGQVNPWLALPLVIWLGLYIAYTRTVALRVAAASEKWSDARSLVTGRVVDAYAN